MSARDAVLARARAALRDRPHPPARPPAPTPADASPAELAALFAERAGEYTARIHRAAANAVADAVGAALAARAADEVAAPADLPASWLPPGVRVLPADLPPRELDRAGGALTGCALAIAETGTVVLDGGPRQGRRALTLVPDLHVCVVLAAQIVPGVAAAFAWLAAAPGRPITFVSGPSATSDIELVRVEGVHGPRRLDIIVVEGEDAA